jgi:tRNA (guanosine-2'-O-)-methyltransferase
LPREFLKVRAAAVAILFVATAACLEVPGAKGPNELDVRNVRTLNMALETACTPSGFELCFDAYDNNCNGVIDEGCGLQTGILQFAIAWSESVDVDLRVSGPDGSLAPQDEPSTAGLIKDRDCKGGSNDGCHGQNVENVFLTEGWPRRGRYDVAVRLEDPREVSGPVKVRLSARIGQRHFTSLVELKHRNDERKFEFTL